MIAFLHQRSLFTMAAVLLAALSFLASPDTVRAAACPAGPVIISAGRTYDQAARSGSAADFANGVARYSDMRSIALFSLGRYRKLLPPARESEYVSLTKKFMGGFMLDYGKDFRVGTLQIVDCNGSPSNTTVTAKTSGGDKVSFRVYKAGGGWLVRDMNVSGIWLVQQMRSTFVGTITKNDGDIDALFKYLQR